MNSQNSDTVNHLLASACQATCSSCCKKGKIFLPEEQYNLIKDWAEKSSPDELDEFKNRSERFDGFFLYDQRDRCQFLDGENLCRLHNEGVKPRECFWWPLHVYTQDEGKFEVRASTSCCSAFKHLNQESPYVSEVQAESEAIGAIIIKKFREVYPGSYSGIPLRTFKMDKA